jgi:hypothetical protein
MEIILILAVGALNIACFFIGAKVGQRVTKGESVELPSVNPIKAIKEHNEKKRAEKEAEREQERIKTIMENIENYDGTPNGQKDV